MKVKVSLFRRLAWAAALALSSALPVSAADLTLGVEPRYPPEQMAGEYKPLVDYLSRATGHKITLVVAPSYHAYWRDLRENRKLDIVLEDAHFAAYRNARFYYVPVVKVAEPASYTLVASDLLTDPTLNTLVGKRVVTMPSPSLGYAALTEMYPNLIRQPEIESLAKSWKDGVEIVFGGDAEATILPTPLAQQYPNLIPVGTSRDFPGAAVLVRPTLDPKIVGAITTAFLKAHEEQSLIDFNTGLFISQWVRTTSADYVGQDAVLKTFFGYRPN